MFKSTDIMRKERHVHTLKELRGVDYSSSLFDVGTTRAADMRNLIIENGVTQKRGGTKEIYDLEAQVSDPDREIRGIYFFEAPGTNNYILAVIGFDVFARTVPKDEDVLSPPIGKERAFNCIYKSNSTKSAPATVAQFFYSAGRVYILTGNDYLAFCSFDEGETYQIRRVEDLPDVYIPTVAVATNGLGNISRLEAVNLLTPKRRQEFTRVVNTEDDQYTLAEEFDESTVMVSVDDINDATGEAYSHFYSEFDSQLKPENEIESMHILKNVRGSITLTVNKEIKECPIIFRKLGSAVDGYAYLEWKVERSEEGSILYDEYYGWISLVAFDENNAVILDNTTKRAVAFENIAEFMIEYIPHQKEDKSALINNAQIGCLFGTDGCTNRLFLSGNASEPNVIRYSGADDFTYFADNAAVVVGVGTPINAFSRIADGTLAVLKNKNTVEPMIYYLTGTMQTSYDESGNIDRYQAAFSVTAGTQGATCASYAACAYFSGDSLILSDDAVYSVVMGENIAVNVKYVKERSYSIGKKLKEKDLSRAIGTVWKNRYYLCVRDEAGTCFVADADYKYHRENDEDQSFNYEWWVWDGIHAVYLTVINDTLVFADKNGKICAFDAEYTDRRNTFIDAGDATIYDGALVLNDDMIKNIDVENDSLVITSETYAFIGNFEYKGKRDDGIYIYTWYSDNEIIIPLNEGATIIADVDGETWKHVVENIDRGTGEITVSGSPLRDIEQYGGVCRWLVSLKGTAFNLKKSEREDDSTGEIFSVLELLMDGDGEGVWSLSLTSLSSDVLTGYLLKATPVVSEWDTAYFDFGSNRYGKTIHSLTVNCEADKHSYMEVEYDTRRVNGAVDARSAGSFSFEDLSFNRFSFETGFAVTHTVRKTIRDFNYIKFTFRHALPCRFALHEVTAEYTVGRKLKGVK